MAGVRKNIEPPRGNGSDKPADPPVRHFQIQPPHLATQYHGPMPPHEHLDRIGSLIPRHHDDQLEHLPKRRTRQPNQRTTPRGMQPAIDLAADKSTLQHPRLEFRNDTGAALVERF
jgi:hypothetical protein